MPRSPSLEPPHHAERRVDRSGAPARADSEGYAGLEDEVDNHWGMLFQAAILSTLLSVGLETGAGDNENSLVQAIRQGASQTSTGPANSSSGDR